MISITIPVYNEEETLPHLRERLLEALPKLPQAWEAILVNDGSTDRTAELLDEMARAHPQFKVVHFRRNFGQTAAMQAGFDFAQGDIIVPMDADLQNDPEDIARLVAELERGLDVCSGWRRNNSRMQLTTRSSALVSAYIEPALPKGVRTPSTKTTSRSSRGMPVYYSRVTTAGR